MILDNDPVTLDPRDFILEEKQADNIPLAEETGTWVCYNIEIDEDLRLEGMMRDLLRHLQVLRKKSSFEIEDNIILAWKSDAPAVERIFDKWKDFLQSELLCIRLEPGNIEGEGTGIRLDNAMVRVWIKKA